MHQTCSIIIPCYKTELVILENYISDINKYWKNEDKLEIILVIDGGLNNDDPTTKKFLSPKPHILNLFELFWNMC